MDNLLQTFALRMYYIRESILEILLTLVCLTLKICQLNADLSDDKTAFFNNPFMCDFLLRLVHIVLALIKMRVAMNRVKKYSLLNHYGDRIDQIEAHMTQDRVLGILQQVKNFVPGIDLRIRRDLKYCIDSIVKGDLYEMDFAKK